VTLTKIMLDARELQQPQPFERALVILNEMNKSDYLYMLHRRNPLPLLELAKNRGFLSVSKKDNDGVWHVIITKDKKVDLWELMDV